VKTAAAAAVAAAVVLVVSVAGASLIVAAFALEAVAAVAIVLLAWLRLRPVQRPARLPRTGKSATARREEPAPAITTGQRVLHAAPLPGRTIVLSARDYERIEP
jgi:hypothetical protein